MTKKIFDILPPKKFERKKEKTKEEKILKKEKPSFELNKKNKRKLFFLSSIAAAILILIILFSFKFSKAEVKIWPETEVKSFETTITIDVNRENSDFRNNILAGKVFEIEKNFSEDFSSSGKLLKRAEGIIRLYNGFTTNSENWLAGTRFVSSDGKLFTSKDRIAVPGAEMRNGKIVPSYVDVPVIASEGGSDYNIEPSHFSIIAFRGTPRYYDFYGESLQPMTGGGEVSQVKSDDLEKAERVLTEKAEKELKDSLRNEIPAGFVFLEDIFSIEVLDKFSPAKEGMELERFNFQVQGKISNISFEKKEIEKFIEQFVLTQITQEELMFKESLEIEYLPEVIDFTSGKLTVSLNFSVKIYPEINISSLKKALMGKSLNETDIFLKNQPQIIKTEIHLFPFWLNSLPNNSEKIEVEYPIIGLSI